jgi:tRNA threonylcarbamoyl adenosine modification protein YeaZ
LQQAQLGWSEIERIAVGVGPGTFTGLRIGVATARGLAQSLAIELVGVSSLQALAQPLVEHGRCVLAVIDARRGEAFVASYQDSHELVGAQALPPVRLREALEQAHAAAQRSTQAGHSPEARRSTEGRCSTRWIAVGDGAVRFAEVLLGLGVEVPPAGSPLHLSSGRAICELGGQATPCEGTLLPDYGRVPDAEIALQEAGG